MWAALDTFIVVSSIWDIVMAPWLRVAVLLEAKDILYYWNNGGGQSFSELHLVFSSF